MDVPSWVNVESTPGGDLKVSCLVGEPPRTLAGIIPAGTGQQAKLELFVGMFRRRTSQTGEPIHTRI